MSDDPATCSGPTWAIAVIDVSLAGYRADRYETNVYGLARAHQALIRRWIRFDDQVKDPAALILAARDETGAATILAPSLAHLRDTHQQITDWADIHVVGRWKTYPRGHRWTS